MPGQNDTDLPVAAARQGDTAAWQRLFDRYQRPVFVFIHELVRDREASLDLVQDTFLRAVRHLPSLRDDHRFGSWLFGIAHQLCFARARRSWRESSLSDQLDTALDDSLPRPGDALAQAEQAAELFALLAELPEGQRAALTLHVLEDFSLEEIAAITAVPLGTVKSRLHHAKRTLRDRLTAASPAPSSP